MTSTTKRDNKLQFDNFVVFFNFLEALQQHCKPELSRLRTATDLKSLATHPEIVQYETVLVDGNFVLRWYKLYADCVTNQKFQSKSMVEEATIIKTALSNRCDLLTKFNDFPAPPSKNLVDMKRYDAELSAMIVRNKNAYNGIQKWFIDRCILTTRFTIAALNLQNHGKGDCYKLKWRSLASTLKCSSSPNFKTKLSDVSAYMMSASPGHCKCESQAASHTISRKPESSAKDRLTGADLSVSRTAERQQHPNVLTCAPTVDETINIAHRNLASEPLSNTEIQPIEKAQSPVVPSPTALKRAVHLTTSPAVSGTAEVQQDPTVLPRAPTVNITFNVAGNMPPELMKRTADFSASIASEPSPKRPRQTPRHAPCDPTKLGKYGTFKQFLEVLRHEFSTELSRCKTPGDIQFFLADRPGMEPFKDILENPSFVSQWILLHSKCEPIPDAKNTMETAVREIELGLENKGSLIKHFADFPEKPQDNNVDDMGRFVEELKVMRKSGLSGYNHSQRIYLRGVQSIMKRKMEYLQLINKHNLPDVDQSRSSTHEGAAPATDAVTVPQCSPAASLAPIRDLSDGSSAKRSAIDYFIKENPNVPEADVYKEFSYLEPEKRNRYVEMAEAASCNVC